MKKEYKTSERKRALTKIWQAANPEKMKAAALRRQEKLRKLRAETPYVFKPGRKVPIRITESGTTAYFREYHRLYQEKFEVYRQTRRQKVLDYKASGITLQPYDPEYYQLRKEFYAESQKRWVEKNKEYVSNYLKERYYAKHPKKIKVDLTPEQQAERDEAVRKYNRAVYERKVLAANPNATFRPLMTRTKKKKLKCLTIEEEKLRRQAYYQANKEKIKARYLKNKEKKNGDSR